MTNREWLESLSTEKLAEWLKAEHIGQSDDDIKVRIDELQAQNEKSMWLLKASKLLPLEVMMELYKHF